jgi:hypothetical protein
VSWPDIIVGLHCRCEAARQPPDDVSGTCRLFGPCRWPVGQQLTRGPARCTVAWEGSGGHRVSNRLDLYERRWRMVELVVSGRMTLSSQ